MNVPDSARRGLTSENIRSMARASAVDVARWRLVSQRLVGRRLRSSHDVVAHLGAVQAQDYAAAKWSVGQRVGGATDASVERALDDGQALRTHVMRPTWHLVAPEDLRWMQELTAPRVHAANASMRRTLDLDPKTLAKALDVMAEALRDETHLTRAEISVALRDRGIEATGQRLAYVMMHAELSALVCSGRRRGKQHTYALVEDRAPATPPLERDEAMARLATRYFTSHGPAQVRDFAWWSGMTLADAAAATDLARGLLEERRIGERVFWQAPGSRTPRYARPVVHLLSIFDELTIAYRDRRDLSDERDVERMLTMGAALTSVIVADGRVVGTWKRVARAAPSTSPPSRSATSPGTRRRRSTRPSTATRPSCPCRPTAADVRLGVTGVGSSVHVTTAREDPRGLDRDRRHGQEHVRAPARCRPRRRRHQPDPSQGRPARRPGGGVGGHTGRGRLGQRCRLHDGRIPERGGGGRPRHRTGS